MARQTALDSLKAIRKGAFADVELHKRLHQSSLDRRDRHLATELVYGCVRRQRTLNGLIDQLGKKQAHQQPPELQTILQLGLYQLRYLNAIPPAAAVNTSVDLAKANGQGRLSGVVNGILRQYLRLQAAHPDADPLTLPDDPVAALGLQHSFPDWIVALWYEQWGTEQTAELCQWFNQVPALDLRVNRLKTTVDAVEAAFSAVGVETLRLPHAPESLRLLQHVGDLKELPGYAEGWWSVQDGSAQLVAHLVDPQPGEVIIDACAAPGGKATHLAELMGDEGMVWACDRTTSRLNKIKANVARLGLNSLKTYTCDSRNVPKFYGQADRVLVDAPCSGLGTLHRHADARWRQTPESVRELATLQLELLTQTAHWLKPGGRLVYATCTLHPLENEAVVRQFLTEHPGWAIQPPKPETPAAAFATEAGWIQVWPHIHNMDGFFMVALTQQ